MLKFIIIFSLASLLNVMLNTMKTIIMYKNDKLSSSLINSVTYGVYVWVVVLMAGDMALWLKMLITAITNFGGVWLSMVILDRFHKDKLWRVDFTIRNEIIEDFKMTLDSMCLPYSTEEVNNGKYTEVKVYCETQKESMMVKEVANKFGVKYFVSESKTL